MRPEIKPPDLNERPPPRGAGERELALVTKHPSPRRARWRLAGWIVAVIALAGITVLVLPVFRWRAQTLWLEVTGKLPEIGFDDLMVMMLPGSGQTKLSRLPGTRNPFPVIQLPPLSAAQKAKGASLYADRCAGCHAPDGTGGPGAPALAGRILARGDTPWALYRTIRDGVPGTGMPPHPLPRDELWELVSYVSSLRVPANEKQIPTDLAARLDAVEVSPEELAGTRRPELTG
jgi:mono/diheme cytochrome c family protein